MGFWLHKTGSLGNGINFLSGFIVSWQLFFIVQGGFSEFRLPLNVKCAVADIPLVVMERGFI